MIKARHNTVVYWFFRTYARLRILSAFRTTVISGNFKDSGRSILLLSNHTSWWDGFWALYLNMKLFKKKFHFMMDEEQLSKRWLFSLSGGYSIRRGSRTIFDSLRYTEDLLANRENLVVIYPQGKIYSSHTPQISFKRGLERLHFKRESKPDIYFLVQLTDYFQYEKSTLFFYLEKAGSDCIESRNYESCYNDFYMRCIEQHSSIIV